MTDQRWDTWIDWDNANGAAMSPREREEAEHITMTTAKITAAVLDWLDGPKIVLPIKGCGND